MNRESGGALSVRLNLSESSLIQSAGGDNIVLSLRSTIHQVIMEIRSRIVEKVTLFTTLVCPRVLSSSSATSTRKPDSQFMQFRIHGEVDAIVVIENI